MISRNNSSNNNHKLKTNAEGLNSIDLENNKSSQGPSNSNNNKRDKRYNPNNGSYHNYLICFLLVISVGALIKFSPNSNNQQQQYTKDETDEIEQELQQFDQHIIERYSNDPIITKGRNSLQSQLQPIDGKIVSYVPIEPFNVCNGRIEKLVCQTTILFETSSGIPNNLILEHNDEETKNKICNMLLNFEQSVTGIPGEYRSSPFFVVRVPVCVQTYDKVGIVIDHNQMDDAKPSMDGIDDDYTENPVDTERGLKNQNTATNDIALVQSLSSDNNTNGAVQRFISSIKSLTNDKSVRIIPLKRIDFTAYYQLGMYTNPTQVERFRDGNYGNMVWRYASTKLINPITNEIDINYRLSLNDFTNRPPIDAMVVATANTFHLTKEPKLQSLIEIYTDRVIANNVPTIVIGIGIQNQFNNKIMQTLQKENSANITDQFHLTLTHPFQETFLRTISRYQSGPAIGVRGDMTKSVCTNSGINNCVSTGCPSLTISRDTNLGRTIETKLTKLYDKLQYYEADPMNSESPLKIAIACPADAMASSFETIAGIIDAFGIDHTTIIIQSEGDRKNVKSFMSTKWININPNTIIRDPDALQFQEFMNVETWLQTASTFDLCISFRIHGSMTFIGSGIPTIVLPTDFRIMELVYAMKLPHVLPSALDAIVHKHIEHIQNTDISTYKQSQLVLSLLHEAYDDLNLEEFELNRRSKIQEWKSILNVANIEMDPSLLRIISTDAQ